MFLLHLSAFFHFPLHSPSHSSNLGLSLFLFFVVLVVYITSCIYSLLPRILIFPFDEMMSLESSAFQIPSLHCHSNVTLLLFILFPSSSHFSQNSYIFLTISCSFINSHFPQCLFPELSTSMILSYILESKNSMTEITHTC